MDSTTDKFKSFIIEGIASVAVGVLTFFALPDSPKYGSKWLKPDEIKFLELSHVSTRGVKATKTQKGFQWSVLWSILTDWQLYLQTLVFMSNAVPNYGLKFVSESAIHAQQGALSLTKATDHASNYE